MAPFIALIMAIASFGMILSEFIPLGLITGLSQYLNSSTEQLTALANLHPVVLIISAPIMGLVMRSVRKKYSLSIHLALFIIGNLIALFSNDYTIFATGRVISVIATGGFLGLAIVYISEKAKIERRFSSISLMYMGVGVGGMSAFMMSKTLGRHFGWATPFLLSIFLVLISLVLTLLFIESEETKSTKTTLSLEIKTMFSKSVLITILATMLGAIGFNIIASNLMPILTGTVGIDENHVGLIYGLFTVGAFLGITLCGKACEMNLQRTSIFTLVAVAMFSILLMFCMGSQFLSVLFLFLIIFSISMVGMTCVAGMTNNSQEAPNMSLCGIISSFQLSSIIGSAIGSFVLHKGFPANHLALYCAIFALLSLSVVLLVVYFGKNNKENTPARPKLEF